MIIKFLILIIFNLLYSLNNYNSIINLVIINAILFLCEAPLITKKSKLSIKQFTMVIIISMICVFICRNNLLYGYKDTLIKIKNMNNVPIRINAIYFDNIKQKLTNDTDNNLEYDIYNKLTATYQIDLYDEYAIKSNKGKKIIINFEKQNEPYYVNINEKTILIPSSIIDHSTKFYKVNDNYFSFEYDNLNDHPHLFSNMLLSIMFFVIIIYSIFNKIFIKKFNDIFLILSLFLFEFNNLILLEFNYKILLFIFIVLIYILLNKMKLPYQKLSISFFLISSIVSFCLIGNLFLIHHFTVELLLIFFLFIIWLSYLLNLLFYGYQYLKSKLKTNNTPKHLDKILLFLVPIVLFLGYYYIFYPFIISTDGDMQMLEIVRNNYSNWHPFFHTLIMKFSYDIFGDFSVFLIIRIIIVSIIISMIGSYFIKKGVKRIFIYVLVILFCLNPVIGIYMVSILKDVDYVICLVLLTFLIIKYANGELNKNILSYILMAITLILVGLFRHNGLYVCVIFSCFLLFLAIIKRERLLFLPPILVCLFIFLYNVYIYPSYKVSDGLRNSDIVSLAHGLQAIVYNHNDIETENYLKTIMPIEEWKDTYNKYNIDILLHYNRFPFRNIECNKLDMIKLYFKKTFRYFNILLADRLYGTDILWNVFKNDSIQTYDYQISRNEFGVSHYSDFKIDEHNNKLKLFISSCLLSISKNKLLNALFLRGGIYLCFITIILYKDYHKRKLLILLPTILNIATLFIAMHHQSYRYAMFLPIIFILLLLDSISEH